MQPRETWPATPALLIWIAVYNDHEVQLALARDGCGDLVMVVRQDETEVYSVHRPGFMARLLWQWKRVLFERCVTRAWSGPLQPGEIPPATPADPRPRLALLYRALPDLGPAPLGRCVVRNATMGVDDVVFAGGAGIALQHGDAVH